jgi:hypothetical protein
MFRVFNTKMIMSIFQVTIFEDASLGMTQEANYHEKDA